MFIFFYNFFSANYIHNFGICVKCYQSLNETSNRKNENEKTCHSFKNSNSTIFNTRRNKNLGQTDCSLTDITFKSVYSYSPLLIKSSTTLRKISYIVSLCTIVLFLYFKVIKAIYIFKKKNPELMAKIEMCFYQNLTNLHFETINCKESFNEEK